MKVLRDEKIKNVKLIIKQQHQQQQQQQQVANVGSSNGGGSSESSSVSSSSICMEAIECQLRQLESNLYQCEFVPKSIDRHFVEIYFDNQLINFGKKVKKKDPRTILYLIFVILPIRSAN